MNFISQATVLNKLLYETFVMSVFRRYFAILYIILYDQCKFHDGNISCIYKNINWSVSAYELSILLNKSLLNCFIFCNNPLVEMI